MEKSTNECAEVTSNNPGKKKNRRGNKGRPKKKTTDVLDSSLTSLLDAVREVALANTELLKTASGAGPSSSVDTDSTANSSGNVASPSSAVTWTVADLNNDTDKKITGSVLKKYSTLAGTSSSSVTLDSQLAELEQQLGATKLSSTMTPNGHLTCLQETGPINPKKSVKKKKSNTVTEETKLSESNVSGDSPEDAAGASSGKDLGQNLDEAPSKPKKRRQRKRKPAASADGQNDAVTEQLAETPGEKPKKIKNKKLGPIPNIPSSSRSPYANNKKGNVGQPSTPGSSKRNSQGSPKKHNNSGSENNSYPDYWSDEQVKEGLENQTLLKGIIRINKKNFREAYINSPSGGKDILLEGVQDRNRALEGDEVAVELYSSEHWKEHKNEKQRKGKVVRIVSQEHHRQAVGVLKTLQDKNSVWALLSPRDSRVPRIRVLVSSCPPNFQKFPNMLYLAEITHWNDQRFAIGKLVSVVGNAGEVEVETQSILKENGLDVQPYGPEMLQYFPPLPYTIPQSEMETREDFRNLCIFTIDPATARDLDDAVSYRPLPGGEAEVGVHISDVAHFLEEGTPLDTKVASRATTTYLVSSVYHMLPVEMCRLCSLTPGEDKLAFSVLWKVNNKGEFEEPRFCRSVINSCCQMAYEQAQAIMDAPPGTVWGPQHVPELHGKFTPRDVAETVLNLQPLARTLRGARFECGALRIDQPKLYFRLDQTSGLPQSFSIYQNMECHRLIEELMLLANQAVAKQLHTNVPDLALLRCHPPPHDQMLPELQKLLAHHGVHLNIDSSKDMHSSLQQYLGETDPELQAKGWALSAMLSKPMARAKYFCASREEDTWHYALSVPLYTHFTSPIRRYADVIVHRLLASTLGLSEKPVWHPDFVHKLASNCNGKKFSAKKAGEQSDELYLTLYVGMHGPLDQEAIVVDVKDRSFDVLVLLTGSTHRVYTNNLDKKVAEATHRESAKSIWEAEIVWKKEKVTQEIKLFSLVMVQLSKDPKELKLITKLLPPRPATVG